VHRKQQKMIKDDNIAHNDVSRFKGLKISWVKLKVRLFLLKRQVAVSKRVWFLYWFARILVSYLQSADVWEEALTSANGQLSTLHIAHLEIWTR